MQIDREAHIDAPLHHVMVFAEQCLCPSALTFTPEGAGTRIRFRAEVTPDDLAKHVEARLVEFLQSTRDHFARTAK